jgi:hypothetical protein
MTTRLVTSSKKSAKKALKVPGVSICVCRNVRTKLTKLTKSSVERQFPQNGTIFLPTRSILANAPSLIRRPDPLAWGWPRRVSRCGCSKLSKLLLQERALSAPCFMGLISDLRVREMLRPGVIRHFDCHFTVAAPKSSCRQALMLPVGWRRMHGQSAPVQGQAEPSWQDSADV